MISVIVCSVKPHFKEQLKTNLANTIGVDYELLCFDNRETNKGLCKVYNELAATAKYPILCFAHEDIEFQTLNWGKTIVHSMEMDFDVVGVAGSKYKSAFYSGWYTGKREFDCAHILHRLPDRDEKIKLSPDQNSMEEEVVCLDGVFICCKKEVWATIRFNDAHLKGFHFYDIDFSIRASYKYKLAVTYNIDLVHFTLGGDFGDKWIENALLFHKLDKQILPVTKLVVWSNTTELGIAKTSLDVLKNQKISWLNKKKWIRQQNLHRYPSLYYHILKFLFYRPLRLNHVHKLFK